MSAKHFNLTGIANQNTTDGWYQLRLFNYYRISLALFFITLYINGWLDKLIPADFTNTRLFVATAALYLAASLLIGISLYFKKPDLRFQAIIHTLLDISCIIILMHAAGGIRTGLGMLLIISVSMSSLFVQKQTTILFAAIATLGIIFEQVYSQFIYTDFQPAFTQAGLLGLLIFISAFLTIYTARRIRESEKLAKETSDELETIVQMNEHIIKSMRTGIIVIRNDGHILMANNAALELLGNISISPQSNLRDVSPALYNRFIDWQENSTQNHKPIQQAQGMPDLQPGFSQIEKGKQQHKSKGRTLIFLEDATQIAQRFQQVKLASLGRLTASIAHEIRNPLAAINHAGQLLDETVSEKADKKLTEIINTQARRLNGIIENVLQLSRQQRGTPENITLQQWLEKFREEFINTHGLQAYQIQIKLKPQDIIISFDPSQLHQVMWNLCSNAINHSAMQKSNTMISINGEIDAVFKQPYIDIIDNGPGISKEIQEHIFDPFFTTRSDGTGLGLYLTKEVIESNRAKIRHITPLTGGTCFRIYFQQHRQQNE